MTHSTALLVEDLLDGAIAAGFCPELRRVTPSTGEILPAQYLLLVGQSASGTRERLRRAARGLLCLLDAADAGDAAGNAGGDADGCAKFRALAAAPEWLLRAADPDDIDIDIALLCEREFDHRGNWLSLIEHLHLSGSIEWQWAIQRCRAMMRFERETGLDLANLVGIRSDPSGLISRITIADDVAEDLCAGRAIADWISVEIEDTGSRGG